MWPTSSRCGRRPAPGCRVPRRAAWAGRFERLVEEEVPGLVALVGRQPVGPPLWSHRDAQPTNVMVTGAGRRVLVDWDNAGGTWADRELGSQLTAMLDRPDQLRSAYDTYRRPEARLGSPGRTPSPDRGGGAARRPGLTPLHACADFVPGGARC